MGLVASSVAEECQTREARASAYDPLSKNLEDV